MPKESHPRLAEVQAAFSQWRRTRTTPRTRTPRALRQQAVGLLSAYRISEVMSALGVNHGQLSRGRRELSTSNASVAVDDFVALPSVALEKTALPADLPPGNLR